MTNRDIHNVADTANDSIRQGYEAASEYAEKGYDMASEYAEKGMDLAANVSSNLHQFVRREPWIALAAAFAVGYTMARMMRRVSS